MTHLPFVASAYALGTGVPVVFAVLVLDGRDRA